MSQSRKLRDKVMMFQVPSSSLLSSIALLLLAGQLIASASCNSVVQATEQAQRGEAPALANEIDRTQDSIQQLEEDGQEASSKFKLIRFEAFQARYGKHYATLLEKVFRLRQFLASLARVSRSIFAYLHKKCPFFLQINRYSDLTSAERRNKFGQPPDQGLGLPEGAGRRDNSTTGERVLSRQKRGWFFGGKKSPKPLEYGVDWRREASPKCLNEPTIVQGECGSCYAMTTMRLFEWLHCRRHGSPIKLSEQYLIDCGREHGLRGCQKGSLLSALKFVGEAGVMRAEELPYAGEEQTCPGDARQRAIQVRGVEQRVVREREKWPGELAKAPLMVFMSHTDNFYDYGGGLFELRDCEQDLGHFMLLVGHGRDPNHGGRPFFLFSNSAGTDYGESGYIRMAADKVDPDCLMYAVGAEADF